MKTNTYKLKSAVALAGAALVPTAAVFMSGMISNAIAGTTTQAVPVSASVAANCKMSNPSAIAFGAYDPTDANYTANLDSTGSFQISCTKGVSAALTINNGANYSSPNRRMIGDPVATTFLTYQLYTSSTRTTVWDATVGGTVTYNAANATKVTQTIYGRIPGGQDVDAQTYSDTVTVTATFS